MFAVLAVSTSMVVGQRTEIGPNENLVAEGIPKIPASLADDVDRYTNARGASFAGWNPVRREILISTRFADTPQIHRVEMPRGDRTQLTFYPDAVFNAKYQPTAGSYFIFSKDVGGGEFFQFYRYDFSTNDIALITDGKSRNTDFVWSHAGDRIAFGSTRRNGNDVDLYTLDPTDLRSNHMLAQMGGGGWRTV